MKALKSVLLASSFALAFAGAAVAATATPVVYLTGSTAYRSQLVAAIDAIYQTGYQVGYDTTSGNEASQDCAVYNGTTKAVTIGTHSYPATTVIIKTSWSGSGAGVQSVAAAIPINFLATPGAGNSITYAPGQPNVTPQATTGTSVDLHAPDMCMSDVFQASTPFLGTPTGADSTPISSYPQLTENTVGVITFEYVLSKGASSILTGSLSNMTTQLANVLFTTGATQASLFTGNSADSTKYVYGIGRNGDSGTRITTLAETGIGVFTQTQQYQPLDAGNNIVVNPGSTIASFQLWPEEVINNVDTAEDGNSGYSSGGQERGAMASTTPAGTVEIGYLGTSDAATAISNGATAMTYNGATFSNTAVEQGQYTYWGYEHLDYLTLSGAATTVVPLLVNETSTVTGSILIPAMQVSRNSDGALVTHN